MCETLLDFCYLTLAQGFATEPVAICEECNRASVVHHKRQIFCEQTCADRARFRRYKEKQPDTLSDTLRSGRGQKTRKRTDKEEGETLRKTEGVDLGGRGSFDS